MSADLSILGITPEQVQAMKLEREGKAPWVNGNGSGYHYPLPELEVGESLTVPYEGRTYEQVDGSVRSCIYRAKTKHGMRFEKTRSDVGIRVTRVA